MVELFHDLEQLVKSIEEQRTWGQRVPYSARPVNLRKVVELPHDHLEATKVGGKGDPKSTYWEAVAELLTDWQLLEAKNEASPS